MRQGTSVPFLVRVPANPYDNQPWTLSAVIKDQGQLPDFAHRGGIPTHLEFHRDNRATLLYSGFGSLSSPYSLLTGRIDFDGNSSVVYSEPFFDHPTLPLSASVSRTRGAGLLYAMASEWEVQQDGTPRPYSSIIERDTSGQEVVRLRPVRNEFALTRPVAWEVGGLTVYMYSRRLRSGEYLCGAATKASSRDDSGEPWRRCEVQFEGGGMSPPERRRLMYVFPFSWHDSHWIAFALDRHGREGFGIARVQAVWLDDRNLVSMPSRN